MDEELFISLVKQHQGTIYKLAFYLLNDEKSAEDVVQETFLKAWERLPKLRQATILAWLKKVAVNQCVDVLRKRKFLGGSLDEREEIFLDGEVQGAQSATLSVLADTAVDPLEQCLKAEIKELVQQAIRQLPMVYRSAVVLRDLEGMSYKEIAQALHLPLNTVKSNVFRGRKMLRQILSPLLEV